MSADLSDSIKRLVKKGKENGFVLISELDEIIKNLKAADKQYIRDGLEELEIQIVKTPKDYDEYKYMTGEQAIEFLQSLSDGKTKAFVKLRIMIVTKPILVGLKIHLKTGYFLGGLNLMLKYIGFVFFTFLVKDKEKKH